MTGAELGAKLIELLQDGAAFDRATLTREESMASMYGEAITKEKAAEILSCSHRTVYDYVQRGLIETCCEGKKIDTRSLARFLDNKTIDRRHRENKKKEAWMV